MEHGAESGTSNANGQEEGTGGRDNPGMVDVADARSAPSSEASLQLDREAPDAEFDAIQRPFAPLLVLAGLTVALAHGANDVGNAIGEP